MGHSCCKGDDSDIHHEDGCCQSSEDKTCGCTDVYTVVGEKGEITLSRQVREKANIQIGDELIVVGLQMQDQTQCLALVRAQDYANFASSMGASE